MKNSGRFIGLDSLRVTMVIFVIMIHCSMTYMDYRPDWWYVLDNQQQIGFTFITTILNCFLMATLFFLAGYFTPASYLKRGKSSFIKDKFLHIGIPWVLGVLLVAPFFSRATAIALGYPPISIFDYFKEYFFSALYQQAHYWFLGILFLFYIIYTFIPKSKNISTDRADFPFLVIVLAFAITLLNYYFSSKYYKPASEWTNIGYVLYFQPARLIGYLIMFALGIYGCRHKWFTEDGWKPSINYLIIGIASCIWLIYWKFKLEASIGSGINLVIDAITYSLISISMTLGLISVFLKEKSTKSRYSLSQLAPYSYGIYWLHQIIAILIMNYLLSFDFSAFVKWSFAMIFTILFCTLITKYILKKTPLLKRIF